MKRPLLLFALPLVLAALMFGVKWRADHPTPTKEDLEIRALLSNASQLDVLYSRFKEKSYRSRLVEEEFEPFVDNFYLLPQTVAPNALIMGKKGIIYLSISSAEKRKDGLEGVNVYLPLEQREGRIDFPRSQRKDRQLHPVTVKRWIELLLAHPRIGPELRKRLNL